VGRMAGQQVALELSKRYSAKAPSGKLEGAKNAFIELRRVTQLRGNRMRAQEVERRAEKRRGWKEGNEPSTPTNQEFARSYAHHTCGGRQRPVGRMEKTWRQAGTTNKRAQ